MGDVAADAALVCRFCGVERRTKIARHELRCRLRRAAAQRAQGGAAAAAVADELEPFHMEEGDGSFPDETPDHPVDVEDVAGAAAPVLDGTGAESSEDEQAELLAHERSATLTATPAV